MLPCTTTTASDGLWVRNTCPLSLPHVVYTGSGVLVLLFFDTTVSVCIALYYQKTSETSTPDLALAFFFFLIAWEGCYGVARSDRPQQAYIQSTIRRLPRRGVEPEIYLKQDSCKALGPVEIKTKLLLVINCRGIITIETSLFFFVSPLTSTAPRPTPHNFAFSTIPNLLGAPTPHTEKSCIPALRACIDPQYTPYVRLCRRVASKTFFSLGAAELAS
ncbi:hypothetical protein EJ04DRAFT_342184 [Polyplosphaeria fusca]|uniref:Uncharacterized protein n=1 Tax=Polyplosphaeria fusca TaxID=682080 RepID=A0A9P4UXJ1_9PLEO|nr:hypothetical protein EJ04DRAFT_342184 [Polyplosphaeria fusca]